MGDIRVVLNEIDFEALGDSWEELVAAGQTLAAAGDVGRWAFGDVIRRLTRSYGKDSVGQYAYAVKQRKSTLYEYGKVSAFYRPEQRELFPVLSWSHYRAAMKAERLDEALIWLGKAADEDWSVDDLISAMKPLRDTPEKLVDVPAEVLVREVERDADGQPKGVKLLLRLTGGAVGEVFGLDIGEWYTLKLYTIPKSSDDGQIVEAPHGDAR